MDRRQTGINTVTRKQPDGAVVRHYYDRRTRRYLGTDRDATIAAAMDIPAKAAPGSFDALCAAYLLSHNYRRLALKTQKLNRLYIDHLRDRCGELPAAAITRPVLVALREANASRPWYATHLLSKLRLVLQHGVDTGVLRVNPAVSDRRAVKRFGRERILTACSPKPTLTYG